MSGCSYGDAGDWASFSNLDGNVRVQSARVGRLGRTRSSRFCAELVALTFDKDRAAKLIEPHDELEEKERRGRERGRGRAGQGGAGAVVGQSAAESQRESCWSRPNHTHRRAPPPPWHGHTPHASAPLAQRLTPALSNHLFLIPILILLILVRTDRLGKSSPFPTLPSTRAHQPPILDTRSSLLQAGKAHLPLSPLSSASTHLPGVSLALDRSCVRVHPVLPSLVSFVAVAVPCPSLLLSTWSPPPIS